MMSFLQPLRAAAEPTPAPASHYAVCMAGNAPHYLNLQLERDIQGKALGWVPSPFTLFQLIDIQKLLTLDEVVNVVMTPELLLLLTEYTAYQWKRAFQEDNEYLEVIYRQFFDHLIPATAIRFSL